MQSQDARNEILGRIKSGKPALRPLPDVPIFPFRGNPKEEFINHLLNFDGRVIEFRTRDEAMKWLKEQPEISSGVNKIYSSTAGFDGNVKEEDLADLKNASRINSCVTEGELGVGEMGAIWVTDKSLGHVACALLSRRLFILLDVDRIVGGLHEAYAYLKPHEHQYGSFFTGPSATADIEAVHITGAQGPLVMTVLLYNCPDAPETPELKVNPNMDESRWSKNMEMEN